MKKWMAFLLVLTLSFVFVGCKEEDPPAKDTLPTAVTISGQKELKVGEEVTLTKTVTPANATNKAVTWSSSDESVVTVDANGKIKALKVGQATITVKCEADATVEGTLAITVKEEVKVTSVEVSGANEVNVGSEITLAAAALPAEAEDKAFTWTSSDTTVATVANGVVKGLKEGTVVITCALTSNPAVKDEHEVAVKAVVGKPDVVGIELAGEDKVQAGAEITLTATFLPEGSSGELVWSSSDETVATVANGVVTGVANGTAKITATLADDATIFAEKEITVEQFVATTDFEISGATEVVEGYTIKLSVAYTPAESTDLELVWSSSDETIATVSAGTVTGIKAGEVKITAKLASNPELSKEYAVLVTTPVAPESLVVESSMETIEEGLGIVLKAVFTPENTTVQDVTWASSNTEVATIDANGSLRAIKAGTTTITATSVADPTISNTKEITVTGFVEIVPASVSITGPTEMYINDTLRLQASVQPAGCNQAVTWRVNDETKATIDAQGYITGLAEGRVRVKAASVQDPTIESSWYTVTVEKLPPVDPTPDLNGYVIEIMNTLSALKEIDPNREDYSGTDKAYKLQAWSEVEKEFNCKLTTVQYPEDAPWGPTRITWISSRAASKTPGADFYVVSCDWIPTFANAGALHSVTDYQNRYAKNQIELALEQASTYKGQKYAVATGLSLTRNYVIDGIYYNVAMLEKYNLESPAKMFNEDRWTYSDFEEWATSAQAKLGEGEFVLSGALQLYWAGMVQSGGVRLADISNLSLNLTHTSSLKAIETLKAINKAGAYDTAGGYDGSVVSFQAGKAIMQPGEYWFIGTDNRFKKDLWGAGDLTRYGYVPFPHADNVSSSNTFVNLVGESVFVMAAVREEVHGASVDYVDIYRAFTATFAKTTKYQKADATFDANQIKADSLRAKLSDVESINAMMFYTGDKTIFDPIFDGIAQEWTGAPGITVSNIINNDLDAVTELTAVTDELENKLIQVYGG